MKVFWSWQSDHPGPISRYAIREALKQAIEYLKQEAEIDEPPEEARRAELHLDQDTEGLSGTPSVADSILAKITASAVVVCDVTPVGLTPVVKGNEGDLPGRPLMNPNVAIELGYAMGKLGDAKVIGVLNRAFGQTDDLPFDLRHKKWPVQYELVEGATKLEIEAEVAKLRAEFIKRLRDFVKVQQDPVPTFIEAQSKNSSALFFEDGEILAVQRNNPISATPIEYRFDGRSLIYLRLIPKKALALPLREDTMKQVAGFSGAFGFPAGELVQENNYGVAVSNLNPLRRGIDNMTQHFRNGEIWALNSDIIKQGERDDENWVSAKGIQDRFISSLRLFCDHMKNYNRVISPITVEAGIIGIKNRRLIIDGALISQAGKMYEDSVVHRSSLPDFDAKTQDSFLLTFFEKVHNNTGIPRPKGLFGWGT